MPIWIQNNRQMGKKALRRVYVAVKYIPRTPPEISWTRKGIAGQIKVHRNSLVFKDGCALVKEWLVYEMEIEPTISRLGRK